jgi:hypothetical protein
LDSRLGSGPGLGSSAEGAATFAMHLSLSRRLGSMQTSHSPHRLGRPALDVIRREAAFRRRGSGG